jgi:translation initiation factor IF-3
LIDEEGTNLGIVDSRFAMNKAKNADLDLIVVNKTATPPVCRIGNYGKMKYEANKKQRENKKREPDLKTLKVRPGTQKHDLDIEVKKAREFLIRGDKVKFECRFRNREINFPDLGKQNIEYIISNILDVGKVEKPCELVMRSMIAIVVPK